MCHFFLFVARSVESQIIYLSSRLPSLILCSQFVWYDPRQYSNKSITSQTPTYIYIHIDILFLLISMPRKSSIDKSKSLWSNTGRFWDLSRFKKVQRSVNDSNTVSMRSNPTIYSYKRTTRPIFPFLEATFLLSAT